MLEEGIYRLDRNLGRLLRELRRWLLWSAGWVEFESRLEWGRTWH